MGARWLAALLAVALFPVVAGAKGEKREDLNEKGARASDAARRVDPGWAKRRVALHLQALGQGAKHVGLSRVKGLVVERRSRHGGGGSRQDGREGWFTTILMRIESATQGRKTIAGHALGDQVLSEQHRERAQPAKTKATSD
jgi:hypothetical protein